MNDRDVNKSRWSSGRDRGRRSIRLRGYDYAQPGAYFITICAQGQESLFGKVVDGEMILSDWGRLVVACWEEIPTHFPNVDRDAFVLMPNHMHGIIIITEVGAGSPCPAPAMGAETAPLQSRVVGAGSPCPTSTVTTIQKPTLGQIVAYFKYQSTKQINQRRGTPSTRIWQRNYFEHIIRTERVLQTIRRYIQNNPARWDLDRYNSAASGPDPDARDLWNLLKTSQFPEKE